MAYQRLQVSEGLAVIPSNTVPIPDPATLATSGTTVGTAVANKLVNTGVDFTAMGIQLNAIVYNTTDSTSAFVTGVDSATTLSLSANIFAAAENYTIYNAATKAATLYVGTTGDLVVQMASQRDSSGTPTLTFKNIPNSAFLPVLVTKVGASTTATDIIALF
jgi:hypothetical protein|tara:strand:+ start:3026 stop:3511 length:486 start_codon:yes stop_codon:yes gene_type:complete